MGNRDDGGHANAGDADFAARLAALRTAFLNTVPQRVAELRAAVEALEGADAETWNDRLDAVRRQAHRTAGTAATYGLDGLAEAHRAVERAAGKGGYTPDLAAVREALAEVERRAETAASGSG